MNRRKKRFAFLCFSIPVLLKMMDFLFYCHTLLGALLYIAYNKY